MNLWVQYLAHHKLGVVVLGCNPALRVWKEKAQKFQVMLDCVENLRPL